MIFSFKKIYTVLNKEQRRSAIFLLILIIVGMGMEIISVGLVIPTLSLLSNETTVTSNSLFTLLIDAVKNFSGEKAVLFMAAILVVTFIIRGIVVIGISWIREKFIAGIRVSISSQIFSHYLAADYNFHIQQNSSTMVRNVIREATNFSSLLNQSFIFISDFFIVLALLALVSIVSPLGSLSAMILFGSTWLLFYFVLGKKIPQWGSIRMISDGLRLQHVQQGIGAYKEVKLLGKENVFVDFYQSFNRTSAKMAQYKSFTKGIPRILFESAAILAIFFVILYQSMIDTITPNLIPKLGLFAVAAFRLLPSINRLASGYNAINFGKPVISTIHEELSSSSAADETSNCHNHSIFTFEQKIILEGINFQYKTSDKNILNDAHLIINKGEMIGLVGESGCGKSTVVDLLLGLLQPQKGHILVDEIDIQNNIRGWHSCIGYVPQTVFLCDDTLANNIAFGVPEGEIDTERVLQSIENANLNDLVSEHPLGLQMSIGENGTKLSGGQRQRVGIARAIYRNPEILILDEATSALDKKTEHEIIQTLEKMHGCKTILLISHRDSTLTFCDKIFSVRNQSISPIRE